MKKFTLYLKEEKHAFIKALANKKKTTLNELINSFIDTATANDQVYSMELRFNSNLDSLVKILSRQDESLSRLIAWHKIHAELLKDILVIEYEEENIND
ncbi:hypothetical protein LNK15_01355 [Jeotgalicoccus huakuii]|nr:hypothetical protein [Jeotgalicoccus huakuii]